MFRQQGTAYLTYNEQTNIWEARLTSKRLLEDEIVKFDSGKNIIEVAEECREMGYRPLVKEWVEVKVKDYFIGHMNEEFHIAEQDTGKRVLIGTHQEVLDFISMSSQGRFHYSSIAQSQMDLKMKEALKEGEKN